jgi:hypothetical protein
MSGSERDDEFDAYLKRRVRFDRRLRSLDRLEPPAELDRIIIAQARQSIQVAPPAPLFRGAGLPAPRWALPMGMAATILISLSVLLDLGVRDAVRRDAHRPAVTATTATAAASVAPAGAAIETAPWPPLPRAEVVEVSGSASTAANEAENTSAAGDSASRSRVPERLLATSRLGGVDASGSANAEPMQATWQAGARMAVVTVIGTRIHQ